MADLMNNTIKQPPLERYIVLMEAIAGASQSGLVLSELASCCNLPPATVHRLLQVLQNSEVITSSAENPKAYVLGKRLLRLIYSGQNEGWLRLAVQPTLDRLADTLEETCFVTRLIGNEVISFAWAVPNVGVRANVFPGHVMPLHAAASAKAILAHLPEKFVDSVFAKVPPRSLTPATMTDIQHIKAEHGLIRQRGYATCWDEIEDGMGALACPVELPGIGVNFALGVTGLTVQLQQKPLDWLTGLIQEAAADLKQSIERGMQYSGTNDGVLHLSFFQNRIRAS